MPPQLSGNCATRPESLQGPLVVNLSSIYYLIMYSIRQLISIQSNYSCTERIIFRTFEAEILVSIFIFNSAAKFRKEGFRSACFAWTEIKENSKEPYELIQICLSAYRCGNGVNIEPTKGSISVLAKAIPRFLFWIAFITFPFSETWVEIAFSE